ncbi:hypothetical protein A9174_24690 [Mesorhizobium loti NZP2037]|uniref:hypothetical protein n=1 Tax=Mesorhizobium sp. 131-3-5 TaxID=2744520 RepID=UPI000376FB2C|nr:MULTISPECIES: hypothetical protein [Mesorhizobium]ANN59599.1 hypothetical protein A9174_24690 [Mesorhizobium loti NZP2037]
MNSHPLVLASVLIILFSYFAYYRVYWYVKNNLLLQVNLSDYQIRTSLDFYVFGKGIPKKIKLLYIACHLSGMVVAILFGLCALEVHRGDMIILFGSVTIAFLASAVRGLSKMIKAQ